MKRRWKMHTKILLFFLGIMLSALVIQTILFQESSSEMIYQQAEEENFNSLENMQDDIYDYIKVMENGLIDIYNEREFIRGLKGNMSIDQLRENYYREAYNIAATNFDTSEGVVALYLYTPRHELISTYRRAATPRHNYPEDIYSNGGEFNGGIVKRYVESDDTTMLISSYYNTSRKTDIVRFVLKLYENSNVKEKIGYVVCDVDSKRIRKLMEKYITDEEVFMWLQPAGDREMLVSGRLDEKGRDGYENLRNKIMEGEEPAGETLQSEKKVFFQVGQSKYNLGAYSLMPESLLEENQRLLTKNLLIIALLMLMIVAVNTFLLSKSLIRPLEQMTQTVKEIRDGNTKQRIRGMKNDEIGDLAQSFNEMLDQIESLISSEYETKLLLKQAEYNALQAQINPHFLYNTLDTMSSIAEIQGCPQVSALSQSLANIFRYSLKIGNPFSNVAKEMVHLKNYIYVMSVRMQDDIEYRFDIEDEVLKDSIPRISIQPLVENALTHGLRNFRGKKKVGICAKAVGENMEIIVEDNGVGMTREKIESLFKDTEGKKEEKRGSIGLNNIHMRMKMLYGEEYGLAIESKINGGTKVTLRIPRRKPEEMNHLSKRS